MNEQIERTPREMVDVPGLSKRAWQMFQEKPVEHLVASLLVVVLGAVSLGVLFGPLSVGQIRMIEKQQRGEPVRIEDVFAGFSSFGSAALVSLIFFVVMMVGFMLFVLPGLFVAAAWGFSLWFVALEDASPTEALGRSFRLLRTQTVSVVVVLVLIGAVNALASTLVLATLLSAPLTMIFGTLAFQDMVNNDEPAP